MTYDFSKITEVVLDEGAHDTPQHGLCFMEMVAWFAGEEHSDTPECACPVLGNYGIQLNDLMYDGARDALLKPLVPLIAGTRDPDSEESRARFLAIWAVKKILPIGLRAASLSDHADKCAEVHSVRDALHAVIDATAGIQTMGDDEPLAIYDMESALDAAFKLLAVMFTAAAIDPEPTAADIVEAVSDALDDIDGPVDELYEVAVEGLRQAILLGRQDGFGEIDVEVRRRGLAGRACFLVPILTPLKNSIPRAREEVDLLADDHG